MQNQEQTEYKAANLPEEAIEKLQLLEGEMRTITNRDVVIVAYENEKNHRTR